ncbi:DUF6134 family protein [uncultured Reyranella sp.]|uniref:DUF6134 family protein n=1 Tax=uncultured Reyranella sp. TaxID=735512 RepID=UPI00259CDEFD|nr:DUF6134 family protein [uncultured Reyranella sp.]
MKRRLILALMLMGCGSAAAQATADFPYGQSHVFAAFRNGERIGTHTLTFQQNGDKRTVTTSIDFAVKALGLTMYRYMHRGQEVWNGNTFESIATQTDDNGTKYTLKARKDGTGVAVVREGSLPKLTASDVGFQQGTPNQATLPPTTLPSTHWNLSQVKQSAMLNSQNGTLAKVQITPRGRETIKTANGTLEATRYTYTGDVQMDQWFDDRGRWVKSAFKASDGSTIEYILQE